MASLCHVLLVCRTLRICSKDEEKWHRKHQSLVSPLRLLVSTRGSDRVVDVETKSPPSGANRCLPALVRARRIVS